MNVEDMIIISVDDHIIEPPNMFDAHVPKTYKASAPKMRTDDLGNNFWEFEEKRVFNVALNAVVGRPREEYGCEPTALTQLRQGTFDVHARIEDMNANGLLASLNFGTFVAFDGSFFIDAKNKQAAHVMVQAYNDWHIDEWCAAHPGRFIPMAITPMWDVDLVVAEVKRVVGKGCHAITFSDNPNAKGLPSIHSAYWEPLWRICNDNNVVINCHIGTGYSPPHPSMESPVDAWITSMPISIAHSAADWLQLKALLKYPDLKIALSEGGIGWVPYFLERADFTFDHHHYWTHTDFGGLRPSDVFKKHFVTCFIEDRFGIKNRHDIGVDAICYECDYPHSDSVWPNSPERLLSNLKGVPNEEIDKITHTNAMRLYSFDPFKSLDRRDCTVGALRAQARHVDTVPKSRLTPDAQKLPTGRVVTSGDVVKQLMANRGKT